MYDVKTEQNDIVLCIYFEAVFIKDELFHQIIIDFVNKLLLNDHKYQTNVTVRYENYLSQKNLLNLCHDVKFMWWGIEDLEP